VVYIPQFFFLLNFSHFSIFRLLQKSSSASHSGSMKGTLVMRVLCAVLLSSCVLLLSGCTGMQVMTSNSSGPVSGTTLHGRVHGGQNPVVGSHVYLFALNNTGYGGPGIPASSTNASISLLTTGAGHDSLGYYVTTDANGDFTITGDYTCPSAYAGGYIYAVGGDSGSGTNSAITLVAGVDPCDTSDVIYVSEVSTIVSVYAYAGFISDPTHASTSGTALAGAALQIAGQSYSNMLGDDGLALATTPAGNGGVPQGKINTLANILAACVNSTGSTSTQCTTLFANATNNSVEPGDTATAAINIAHNPDPGSTAIANLYGLQTPTSPFQPMRTTVPPDFTIAITYTGGLYSPGLLAIDGSGNVWVANNGTNGASAYSIAELNPAGSVTSGSSGYIGGGLDKPFGIAIDKSGNVWVTNKSGNTISEFNSSGVHNSNSPFSGGGLSAPWGISIDQSGHLWIANNSGNSISEFGSGGSPITGSGGIATGGLNDPLLTAIDVSGNVWVSNSNADSISEFNSSGAANGSSPFTGGGVDLPGGIAIDASGDIWTANSNNSLSQFNSSGSPISGSGGDTGGGLDTPLGIAVDGAGNVWVGNQAGNSISEFTSSGTAITGSLGYTAAGLDAPNLPAIDGAGNLWITNGANNANSITEFVGVATPVVTPIVANLLAPYGSHAVNKP
jgi:streptogramin lyase